MKTITIKIEDTIYDKFKWLLSHFTKDEAYIVEDFDYISKEDIHKLEKISNEYKNGNRNDFEEYSL
ncbi:MAG: Unknown protein [uncultured Campylobacterales bacterium]|uniref:Uncharacterized protein n=1 Tax=uncultured Campylobacterales bacterium TaxID=352960 RepID=A0A6S6SXQ2_9BACT|nr:MAG: Unknown protein [uncultured Campylobacterales bacterium]